MCHCKKINLILLNQDMMGQHIFNKQAERLEVQGAMAALIAEEEACISWQSIIFAVPRGVMAWMAKASTHGTRTCIKRKKIHYGKFFDFCAEKCI